MKGLDVFTRKLDGLAKVLEDLKRPIPPVQFDPGDPASIEAAIAALNASIDERAQGQAGNDMVATVVQQLKDKGREAILRKAAEARLASSDEEDADQ
jgi:hypothetical protein